MTLTGDINEANFIYIFVKEADITDAMINRSTSTRCSVACLREITFKSAFLLIPINDKRRILKFRKDEILSSNIVDSYDWYTQDKALQIIDTFCSEDIEADTP